MLGCGGTTSAGGGAGPAVGAGADGGAAVGGAAATDGSPTADDGAESAAESESAIESGGTSAGDGRSVVAEGSAVVGLPVARSGREADGPTVSGQDPALADGAATRDGEAASDAGAPDAQDADPVAGDESPRPPEDWAGTISVETLPASTGTAYLVLEHLRGEQREASEMTPEDLLRTEFLASQSAECEGAATLAGDSASCLLQADVYAGSSGPKAPAQVRLVPTAFGTSALLISVDEDGLTDLALADDAELGMARVVGKAPDEVVTAELEVAAIDAVALAAAADGPLPEGMRARCTVLDEGRHALCEVSGTEGGGDGLWYATVQPCLERIPGSDSGYLFTRRPA
jgi:hypothetical protein